MAHEDPVKAIRAAFEHDRDINLHRYPLGIEDGEVIRLTGEVADIRAKRKALRLAREASGRDDVLDELRIETGTFRGVDELCQAAIERLKGEPAFAEAVIGSGPGVAAGSTDWIGVDAVEARVILEGALGGLSQRRLAEVLCWWLPGCADVDNRIHVEPPEPASDTGLTGTVEAVLEIDPAIEAGDIGVGARDAAVRLQGAVATEAQRQRAEFDCWYIPGVHAVDNRLATRTP